MENLNFNGKIEISEPEKLPKNRKIAMMDLGAFQPAIAMIFHVESEFAVKNARCLYPDPEN